MDKYKGLYRVPSARLPHWDYSSDATYFVTICTKDKVEYFGTVVDGRMELSRIGQVAHEELLKTEGIRKEIQLDTCIIMPNHIHIIVKMVNSVETQGLASLQSDGINQFAKNTFKPQSRNLASAIRGYKMSVKAWATTNKMDFHWQPRYYDHVIRDEKSLHSIQEYIVNNPMQWDIDEYNSKNVHR